MVSINSLTFDLSDCSLREQTEKSRLWVNSSNVAHMLRFEPCSPDWPFDLTDSTAATEFYQRQSQDLGGVMLSLEVTTVAGAEALRGLFKYRAPTNIFAMYYVGILWLPFQNCNFQINVEAIETGLTGARETFGVIIEPDSSPRLPPNTPPVPFVSAEESFRRLESAPVCQWPSDSEQYDELFPDHPLSKVRRRITEVMATLEIDPNAKPLMPFRIRSGWRFWR